MKIGFIGCGNMGGALASAVSKIPCAKVYIYDYNEEKSAALASEISAEISDSNTIASSCDFIFFGVKPNVLPEVLKGVKSSLSENKRGVSVSMAAGVSLDRIGELIGELPVIRIMPNTPVKAGAGMISYTRNAHVSDEARSGFMEIMAKAGRLIELDESLIDAATAVAGCGPAFVYMFAEALADGGVQCGLPRDKAIIMAAETLKGAAEMILTAGKHPGQLKDEVCSPGGSTIEGVHALEEGAFRADVSSAVTSAYNKTRKLG